MSNMNYDYYYNIDPSQRQRDLYNSLLGGSSIFNPLPSSLTGYGDKALTDFAARIDTELKARADKKAAAEAQKKREEEEAKRPKPGDIVRFKAGLASARIRILVLDPKSDAVRLADKQYGPVGEGYVRGIRLDGTTSPIGGVHDAKVSEVEKVPA